MLIGDYEVRRHAPQALRPVLDRLPCRAEHARRADAVRIADPSSASAPWTVVGFFKMRKSADRVSIEHRPHSLQTDDDRPDTPRSRSSTDLHELSDAARNQLALAEPLAAVVSKVSPEADGDVWAELSRHDALGAMCLSRMIENAIVSHVVAGDSDLAKMYIAHLRRTLAKMEGEFKRRDGAGTPPFTERVLALAKAKLGTDDRALLGDLSAHFEAEKLGFTAAQDLHITPGRNGGACHCVATEWAACKVANAPFKAEGTNAEETNDKQAQYAQAVMDAVKLLTQPHQYKQMREAADGVNEQFIKQWASEFTDAKGTKHTNAVSVGPTLRDYPPAYLSEHPLADREVLVALMGGVNTDGTFGSSHTIAIAGGSPPQLFDSFNATIFDFTGNDLGQALIDYQEMFLQRGDWTRWRSLRLTPQTEQPGAAAGSS